MNYVMRNGKRIEVETLEDANPRRRSREAAFVMVPLGWADAMTKATNTRQAFVCILLLYAAWKAKGEPFAFTNTGYRTKIDRQMKRRTLDALEGAGLIKVERHNGRAPIITLVDPVST
jgi:hypothetical protein